MKKPNEELIELLFTSNLLRSTVDSIQWIGKRADRFFTLWNETLPDMEQWVAILDGFATELEDQARRMQIADEAV